MFADRVLSGMRPTGRMHIGHYHGALKNWLRLQEEYECLYFAADWHALTTHFDASESIADSVWEMMIDWLAGMFSRTEMLQNERMSIVPRRTKKSSTLSSLTR